MKTGDLKSIFAQFKTIEDLKIFGGNHQIKMTLEDDKGGVSNYQV